uniref:Uncharacterized protein n=1 Tax=Oryza brachyantha TaxID=4533 RepID=J3M6L1_ORYBR
MVSTLGVAGSKLLGKKKGIWLARAPLTTDEYMIPFGSPFNPRHWQCTQDEHKTRGGFPFP